MNLQLLLDIGHINVYWIQVNIYNICNLKTAALTNEINYASFKTQGLYFAHG